MPVIPSRDAPTLRPMTLRDAQTVGAIDARAFGAGAWPSRAFQAELRENRLARYFVAERAGEVLGYVGCWALADALHVVTLGVDPAHHQRGIGELLVLRALDLAAELGSASVTLECRASNRAARSLYGKHEFAVVGRRRRYYSNGEDALIMTASGVNSAAYRARVEERRAAHVARRG